MALSAASAPSFAAPRHYATGVYPVSVAIGDLNGDGAQDLAIANGAKWKVVGTVSVLLNRGDGSFPARRDYAAGRRPQSVAIADLNGDGKLDVAIAAGAVSVLLNRGDGRFRRRRDYASSPTSVATGDLNGDRTPDLLVSTFNSVSVFVNRGKGRFRAGVDYPIDRHPGDDLGTPVSVASGDLNGDRRPDLVTANSIEDNVSVLINTRGLCPVQDVVYQTLPAAKRAIVRAKCRVGKISRAYSGYAPKGLVISQKPMFGAVLPIGSKVNLVVSRGQKG